MSQQVNRNRIITNMCYTWRHDFGLLKDNTDCPFDFGQIVSSGMTKQEQETLWNNMAQVFDNDIAPVLKQNNIEII